MTYGERFRQLRQELWAKKRVIDLAHALGRDHSQAIYGIEARWRVPALDTIAQHAKALGCDPWELLEGVETEFDTARKLNTVRRDVALAKWGVLMERHDLSRRGIVLRDSRPAKRRKAAAKAS